MIDDSLTSFSLTFDTHHTRNVSEQTLDVAFIETRVDRSVLYSERRGKREDENSIRFHIGCQSHMRVQLDLSNHSNHQHNIEQCNID